MNRKLILAAIAVTLSVGSVQAASNISGVTPTGNTYNITPAKFNGDIGYRKYENFVLGSGDKANLIFERPDATKTQPNHFINLVQNRVNINGVLNTVRNDAFYSGHAIFITPGGFTVGSSGVLNVGQLSVATPSAAKYNQLLEDYANGNYHERIDQVNKLKQDSNATIVVEGNVLARKGVDLRGTGVDVSGTILNGVSNATVFDTKAQADALFSSLVNTDGTFKDDVAFVNNGGRILIKSHKNDGMNVTGIISNGKGDLYLTNNGVEGMTVNGAKLNSNTLTRLYSANGAMAVSANSELKAPEVIAQNRGASMTFAGDIQASNVTTVQNEGGTVNLTNSNIEAPTVRILNKAGAGMIYGENNEITATDALYIVNKGEGIELYSNITNNTKPTAITAINNYNGDLKLGDGATINTKGKLGVLNRDGNGQLLMNNTSINNNGDIRIINKGTNGMTILDSDITNVGDLRIYNDAGQLAIGQDESSTVIQNTGDVYIGARKNSTGLAIGTASINNEGNMYIRNKGAVANNSGLTIGTNYSHPIIENKNGVLAINNDRGNMQIGGKTNIKIQNGQMGIINRSGGNNMVLAGAYPNDNEPSTVTIINGTANIKNNGQGNMTVNSVISNTAGADYSGRVNVIANHGSLTMNGAVHNNAGAINNLDGGFYAVVRQNGTGATIGSQFVVDGNGEVMIKNVSGQNGLNYQGTINTTGHQAALSNKAGALNVSGSIATTDAPIIIYNANTGSGLYVTDEAVLNSGTQGKLINTAQNPMQVSPNAQITNMKKYGNK